MPELPEVETTRRGLGPFIVGKSIESLEVREPRLRWPVPRDLDEKLSNRCIVRLGRRGKYLLIVTDGGTLVVHLGMSGSLRYLPEPRSPGVHDHVDIRFADGARLRFNDPRRFGSLHFSTEPLGHPLLRHLGPEPLGDKFDGEYLERACEGRRVAIKQHLMNGRVVAGIGNIYANEALFRAGIHPARQAGRIARRRLDQLAGTVRDVLNDALGQGGTTLRDFVASDGRPGYFKLSLEVYDREHAPCTRCGRPIRMRRLGQRATYYCAACQR
ncbi:bifunctional DNA-formamidopyrimidine glycosylase/DNA-(apurinic or apyrimidinic site) lyase [Candidatus Rariloculus sp.]|uniref:bifunctional DNA-formamidopyrimidine glycosylase/DNA-(apurinic or apyrimidinic site) lyase n=1 Tax=Candidatus Rariloculus sp. TaxID=3101265 RepID=UPI003D0C5845